MFKYKKLFSGPNKIHNKLCFFNKKYIHLNKSENMSPSMKNFIIRAKESIYSNQKEKKINIEKDLQQISGEEWNPSNINEDKEIIKKMIEACISNNDIPNEIKSLVENFGLEGTKKNLYDLLIKLGIFHKDENINKYSIKTILMAPKIVKECAELKYKQNNANLVVGDRTIFDDSVFTIDGPTAHEIDDALSVIKKGNEIEYLLVHIADPTAFLEVGDELEKFARYRGTTIYLPDACYPMFPNIFSQNLASIKRGQDNYAFTFALKIDHSGGSAKISDLKLIPSILKNVSCLIYDDVSKFLETNDPSHIKNVHPTSDVNILSEIELLCNDLRSNRKSKVLDGLGEEDRAGNYNTVTVSLRDGVPVINPDRFSRSSKLIEEAMISAGATVAQFSLKNEIPLIYRLQTLSSDAPISIYENIDDFEFPSDLSPENQRAIQMIESKASKLRFSFFSPKPNFHADLNLDAYSYVTSPLRRYPDVINHFQLKAFQQKKPYPFSSDMLQSIAGRLCTSIRDAKLLENKSDRYWTLRYIENNMDRVYSSVPIKRRFYKFIDKNTSSFDYSTNTFKANHLHSVMLTELGTTFDFFSPRDIPFGELIKVKCSHVDPFAGYARFEYVD